jgi:hypothetical protein
MFVKIVGIIRVSQFEFMAPISSPTMQNYTSQYLNSNYMSINLSLSDSSDIPTY